MDFGWLGYAAVFGASLALSLTLTPVARRVATRLLALDHPGGHKGHESPVPYLGGVAIVVSFAVALMGAALLQPPVSGLGDLAVILGSAVVLSLMGLYDDLRGLGPLIRVLLEIAAGIAVWATGNGVAIFAADPANAALTVVWVVGIANAFNLLDNMDGLSAGVAAIAGAFFFLLAAMNGQFLVAALAAALAGCSLGFLRLNLHPASIYMGDAGSLFLGFLLAVIGMKLRFAGPTEVTFLVPILVLGVAIFDTALVTVNRLRHGRSPLAGGRDHTSHRLAYIGIPVPAAVALIYAGATALGWLAIVMARIDVLTGFLLGGLVATVALFLGVMLSTVPVYENSRRRLHMLVEVRHHEPQAPGRHAEQLKDAGSEQRPPAHVPVGRTAPGSR